jgi:hypothetical protein
MLSEISSMFETSIVARSAVNRMLRAGKPNEHRFHPQAKVSHSWIQTQLLRATTVDDLSICSINVIEVPITIEMP